MEEKVMSFGRMASITHAMQEACEHQYIKSEYTGGGGGTHNPLYDCYAAALAYRHNHRK